MALEDDVGKRGDVGISSIQDGNRRTLVEKPLQYQDVVNRNPQTWREVLETFDQAVRDEK